MRSIVNGISRNKHHISFFITLVTSVVLYLSNSAPEIIYLRGKFLSFYSVISRPINHIHRLLYIEEENALLREKITKLNLQVELYQFAREENIRLKELLDFKTNNPLEIVPGNIISTGVNTGVQSAVIDLGRTDGIKTNSPVLTENGIIGKIILVSDRESIIQLLNDINFRLGVRIQPGGATGIMRYVFGRTCEVHEVPKNAQISVGDEVITSGFSDIYPPDLPVGIVTGVYEERGSLQKVITIRIHNDLNSLRHVFVIKE